MLEKEPDTFKRKPKESTSKYLSNYSVHFDNCWSEILKDEEKNKYQMVSLYLWMVDKFFFLRTKTEIVFERFLLLSTFPVRDI